MVSSASLAFMSALCLNVVHARVVQTEIWAQLQGCAARAEFEKQLSTAGDVHLEARPSALCGLLDSAIQAESIRPFRPALPTGPQTGHSPQ